jgi:hypothetical protein
MSYILWSDQSVQDRIRQLSFPSRCHCGSNDPSMENRDLLNCSSRRTPKTTNTYDVLTCSSQTLDGRRRILLLQPSCSFRGVVDFPRHHTPVRSNYPVNCFLLYFTQTDSSLAGADRSILLVDLVSGCQVRQSFEDEYTVVSLLHT